MVYGPAITIAVVAATVLATIAVGISAAVASWSIVLGLIALTAALTLARHVPSPDAQAIRPVVLMLIVYAFLVGFSLVPSNPTFNTNDTGRAVAGNHVSRPHHQPPRARQRGRRHLAIPRGAGHLAPVRAS
jgi:hypothetical protein